MSRPDPRMQAAAALGEPIADWLREELDWREGDDPSGELSDAVEAGVRESLARRRRTA